MSVIDFIALYRELDIGPECSPEEFKRAYRRRVSELHPDRSGERLAGEEALKALNLGYAAALDFFHAHGRFPGAPAPRSRHPGPQPVPDPLVEAAHPDIGPASGIDDVRDPPVEQPPAGRRWLRLLLIVLAIVFVALQFSGLHSEEEGAAGANDVQAQAAAPTPEGAASAELRLAVGMPSDEVLSLLGSPTDTAEEGRQWHYGPSWIRMSCGQVREWYSSPLKPLGASRMHPSEEDVASSQPPRHCADRVAAPSTAP